MIMNKSHIDEIKRLKKKLSLFLTGIITFLIIISTIFISIWNFMIKKEEGLRNVIRDKKIVQDLFPRKPDIALIDPIIDIFIEKIQRNIIARENFLLINQNIFVVYKNEIIVHNIVSPELKIDLIENEKKIKWKLLNRFNNERINIFEWSLFIKSYFKSWDFDIFIINRLWYSRNEVLSKVVIFILLLAIISVFLYILSIKISGRILRPVEKNLIDMNDFIDNAGHELKTPLAVINSDLLLLKELQHYDESFIKNSLKETKKMHNLLDCLMTLSWVAIKEDTHNINLYKETWEVLERFNLDIKEKEIKIKVYQSWDNEVKWNLFYIDIILSNLIWNAIKHSPKNSNIIINIKDKEFEVIDYWEWIKKENLEKIFKRFFREDESRNSNWFGIGLSLVKRICEVYNYKIKVESEKWKWTIFKVFFKK